MDLILRCVCWHSVSGCACCIWCRQHVCTWQRVLRIHLGHSHTSTTCERRTVAIDPLDGALFAVAWIFLQILFLQQVAEELHGVTALQRSLQSCQSP